MLVNSRSRLEKSVTILTRIMRWFNGYAWGICSGIIDVFACLGVEVQVFPR